MEIWKYSLETVNQQWDMIAGCRADNNFYQSLDFARSIEILQTGKAVFFLHEGDAPAYLMGYAEKAGQGETLHIIRPAITEQTLQMIDSIQSSYSRVQIISCHKSALRHYRSSTKSAGLFITPIVDLTRTPEQIFDQYSSNRKNIVKRIRNQPFVLKTAATREDLHAFYCIYADTMQKNGHFSELYSERQFGQLLALDSYRLLLCYHHERLAAGQIVIDYGNTIEARYVAVDGALKRTNAGTYTTHQCILHGCMHPKKSVYDFSGYTCLQGADSKLFGINEYKKSFGPMLKRFYVMTI